MHSNYPLIAPWKNSSSCPPRERCSRPIVFGEDARLRGCPLGRFAVCGIYCFLPRPIPIPSRPLGIDCYEHDARDKSSHVRPKGDSAGLAGISNRTRCPTKKLIQKPEPQHHTSWQVKETKPEPGEQSRPWIEHEIGPQHASNRAAGTHVGYTRKRVQD